MDHWDVATPASPLQHVKLAICKDTVRSSEQEEASLNFCMHLNMSFTVPPYLLTGMKLPLLIRDCVTVYICLTICPTASPTQL